MYCHKLHVHTDAFFGKLFLCVYINIHILDIYIDVSMYACVHTCMYRCYMTEYICVFRQTCIEVHQ